ncbi:MAG: hypothetical protein QXQ40_01615 [Candidatus Aenigmatarchaeota archaeon]
MMQYNNLKELKLELESLLDNIKSLDNELSVSVYKATIDIFSLIFRSRRKKVMPIFTFGISEVYGQHKDKIKNILDDAWNIGYRISECLENSKQPIVDMLDIMLHYRLDDIFL